MASVHSASSTPTLAVVIVVDSSITLASEWPRILHDYLPHLFRRLAGENPSSFAVGFAYYAFASTLKTSILLAPPPRIYYLRTPGLRWIPCFR